MANITIPNLPQSTSLDGTEQLLGVQSGTSKSITISQITTYITGTYILPVANGGTGNTTFDNYGILYGDGTNPVESITPPTGSNYILVASPGTVPAWQENIPVTAGVNSISFGSTGLTPNTATEGIVTVAGTLATANGGTNLTSFTANGAVYATSTSVLTTGTLPAISGGTGQSSFAVGDLLYANTTTTLAKLADVATGSVLISGGVGVAPSYSASPTLTTSLTTPLLIGGTTASSTLTLQSTSGVGTSDSILFKVGNNGATTAITISSAGVVSLNTALAVGSGGTGAATFTANGVIYGNTTSALGVTAAGTTGQVLVATTSGAPSWGAIPSTAAVTSITFGTTGLTPNTATTGAVTVAGTLVAANGGTGQSSYAVGDLLYASTTTALSKLADVATGSVLISGGVGVAPSYSASPTLTTSLTTPLLVGGTGVGSSLTLQSTSGVGTSDSIAFKVGNNGATTAMTANTSGNIEFRAGTAALPSLTTTGDTNTGIFFPAADTIAFTEGGAEAMRIDSSGNVGIGTSSPAYKLDVAGAISTNNNLTFTGTGNRITGDFSNATEANRVAIQTSTVNGGTRVNIISNGTGSASSLDVFGLSDPTNAAVMRIRQSGTESQIQASITGTGTYLPMTFYTGGTERLRINSSGNVGIGTSSYTDRLTLSVSPSTAGSSGITITDGTRTLLSQITGATYSYNGVGANENLIYAFGNPLTFLADGQSIKFNAGSAEAMRIDTAGNVGIGTTGGAGKLQVKAATNQNLVVQGSVSLANSVVISAVNDAASANVPLEFRYGTNTAFIQDGTERMRIDSSGNVGIGTSSPTQKVSIAGGLSFNSTLSFTGSGYEIGKDGADFLCFSSGTAGARFVSSSTATEFMRIDSAGNMQLGSASTPEPARLFVSSTSVSAVPCVVQQTAAGATNQNSVVFYRNSASTGSISATATTTAYNTSSDYRLKENVQPMQNALAIISALKPSTYDWIGHDESGEGFLAHELQEIIPIAVMGVKDAVNDDGSIKAQGVDHSKIVVHLVAAIQEQQAMIIALTARITALEVTP